MRFKFIPNGIGTLGLYLWEIYFEARKRGYDFDERKINKRNSIIKELTITKGQLEYEMARLQNKLYKRDRDKFWDNQRLINNKIEPHPLFHVVEGEIEEWERIK